MLQGQNIQVGPRNLSGGGLDQSGAATLNRNAILEIVRSQGPLSRTDLWQKSKLGRSTITKIVRDLQDANLILEVGQSKSSGGRKPTLLEFNSEAKWILAVTCYKGTISLLDLMGNVQVELDIPLLKSETQPDRIVELIGDASDKILGRQNISKSDILGLGLILSGEIDHNTGTVVVCAALGWKNVPIRRMLEDKLKMAVFVERGVHAVAMGEYLYGAGQKSGNMVAIVIEPKAIGASFILDGKVRRGEHNCCGEIGHIPVVEDGPLCSCGNRGCLEAVMSQQIGERRIEKVAHYVGLATACAVNSVDPRTVVLCGSVIEEGGDKIIEAVQNAAKRMFFGSSSRKVQIRKGVLGSLASIKGICGLMYEQVFHTEIPHN